MRKNDEFMAGVAREAIASWQAWVSSEGREAGLPHPREISSLASCAMWLLQELEAREEAPAPGAAALAATVAEIEAAGSIEAWKAAGNA